jgi:hypothetical protein
MLAAVALVATPAAVAAAPAKPNAKSVAARQPSAKPKKIKVTVDSGSAAKLRTGSLDSFTPSIVDPARAPGVRAQTAERSFRFTPSGKAGDRKALTLGLTSRVVTAADPVRTADASKPAVAGYNVGVAVGWKGFSLSGGYSRLDDLFGPSAREGVDLGVSYRGKNWKTTLQAAAEMPTSFAADPLGFDRRYSVELGGAYSLSPRLSLQGGMRYRAVDPKLGQERDDPSIYVGTAFSF